MCLSGLNGLFFGFFCFTLHADRAIAGEGKVMIVDLWGPESKDFTDAACCSLKRLAESLSDARKDIAAGFNFINRLADKFCPSEKGIGCAAGKRGACF